MSLSRTLYPEAETLPAELVGEEVVSTSEAEPLSATELKAYLRVDHSEEDDLILDLIAAARQRIESEYGVAMLTQTIEADFIGRSSYLELPRAPLQSITSAQIREGAEISAKLVTSGRRRVRVSRSDGQLIMGVGDELTVTYQAGFSGSAPGVPQVLKQAIRMAVADWFQNRGTVVVGTIAPSLPSTVDTLLSAAGYKKYEV